MPTTPNGRWSPDDGDDWDLTIDLAAMAISDETATTNEINSAVAPLKSDVATYSYTSPAVPDGVLTNSFTLVPVSAGTTSSAFITSITGSKLTLNKGLYTHSFSVSVGSVPATGRSFAEATSPSFTNRSSVPVGEYRTTASGTFYIGTDGTVVTFSVQKQVGGVSIVAGHLCIAKIG